MCTLISLQCFAKQSYCAGTGLEHGHSVTKNRLPTLGAHASTIAWPGTKWCCVETSSTQGNIAQFSARVQGLDLVSVGILNKECVHISCIKNRTRVPRVNTVYDQYVN